METALSRLNLSLRGVMEFGVIAAFGYWGYHTGTTALMKVLLTIGTPILGFGIWGLIDFHQLGAAAEPLRLIQELLISGLAAAALYVAGQPAWGLTLAAVSIIHHALVYGLGETLIKSS
ncbi:MAG: YrdB family protein [Anaerolineales bacterium]|jgi:hypothetical protein